MSKHKKRLIQDIVIVAASISFAIYITMTGFAHQLVLSLDGLRYLGIFIAGLFFTSIFTTGPSIALLSEFAQNTPLFIVAPLGGLGAALGDYIIFRFVRDRIAEDLAFMLTLSIRHRMKILFKGRLFRFFIPCVGALIIASPLPDEVGIAMLGLSKVSDRVFLPISFMLNSLGIFVIGLIARYMFVS